MDIEHLLKQITPEIYQRMKSAVETGKWPDGSPVTAAQRDNCLQLVIAWDARNLPEEERTGWLPPKPARGRQAGDTESPLRLIDTDPKQAH